MQPLYDGDILLYEIGFGAEIRQGVVGGSLLSNQMDILFKRMEEINATVGATKEPILYFSSPINFRNEIAKQRGYKKRQNVKPKGYLSFKEYLKKAFESYEVEGLEADDLLAIEQTKRPEETIICSRDKDLWQVPGWHYSWEMHNQPRRGPEKVSKLGFLSLNKRGRIYGAGDSLLYAQMLVGDVIDTVPGLKGTGHKKAYNALNGATTRKELFERTKELYDKVHPNCALEKMKEQAQLVFLIRKLDERGKPVMWEPPNGN